MSEHAFFECRAKLISAAHTEDQGELIHCLIKMEIGTGHRRSQELLEQEAGDLILFSCQSGTSPQNQPFQFVSGGCNMSISWKIEKLSTGLYLQSRTG
jgi:hypothetical protein